VSWQDKKGFAIQSAIDMSGRVPQQRAAAAAPPAYRPNPQGVQGGPQGPRGPQVVRGPQVMEGPEIVDGPVYYDAPPPPVVYYGGPYYRPYWGWRRHWW
jgi:hypothetical protein